MSRFNFTQGARKTSYRRKIMCSEWRSKMWLRLGDKCGVGCRNNKHRINAEVLNRKKVSRGRRNK